MRVEIVEPVVCLVEQRLQWAESGRDALLADGEELGLRAVDRLLDLGWVLVPDAGDPPRRADQVAEDRLPLDDPGVLRDVDSGRGLVGKARKVGAPTDRFQLVAPLQRLCDG